MLPSLTTQKEIIQWLKIQPELVLRVKGIAKLLAEGWHVFEMVQGFKEITFNPVKGEPIISPRAVLIAPRLSPQQVVESMLNV